MLSWPLAKANMPSGGLAAGYLADVVVFDPATIIDHATYEKPQQYATGVKHVFVNGRQVLREGEHTGATPGRFVRGPGVQRKAKVAGARHERWPWANRFGNGTEASRHR